MLTRNSFLIVLATLVLIVSVWSGVFASGNVLEGGNLSEHIYGPKVAAGDTKGKVVFFEYWGINCPPCRASFPKLVELQSKYATGGKFVVFASHVQKKCDKVLPFLKENKVNFPVYQQVHLKHAPCGRGIPSAFLFGHDGKIIKQGHPSELYPLVEAAVAAASKTPAGDSAPSHLESILFPDGFKRADTNRDGKLSPDEFAKSRGGYESFWKISFERADKNGDGFIDQAEAKLVMVAIRDGKWERDDGEQKTGPGVVHAAENFYKATSGDWITQGKVVYVLREKKFVSSEKERESYCVFEAGAGTRLRIIESQGRWKKVHVIQNGKNVATGYVDADKVAATAAPDGEDGKPAAGGASGKTVGLPNFLADAKIGEWATYRMADGTHTRHTVSKIEDGKVHFEVLKTQDGKETGKFNMSVAMESGPDGKERTISKGTYVFNGKSIDCWIVKTKFGSGLFVSHLSDKVPGQGILKTELEGKTIMELVDFGFGDNRK